MVVWSKTVVSGRFSTPRFMFHDLLALMMPGSALNIAIIVGGIPADLLKIKLKDSFEMRSRVLSNICLGRWANIGTTKRRPTKVSRLSAVISMAPLCLNWKSMSNSVSHKLSISSFYKKLWVSGTAWGNWAHLKRFYKVSPFSLTASQIPTKIKFS